jgi:enoyl-[acyl-carrier protein] reductase II
MNRITSLFGIKYPVVSGGMVWCSGWRLAAAVSNAGGLGLIGAGSMHPETLREHIQKCRAATKNPFGVNVPLLYPEIEKIIEIIIEEKVSTVFSSAGNPKTWTSTLKENGIKVAHVVSSSKFALKAQQAGVDAVVAEGFEAGGHNGAEETTTMVLIPQVRQSINIPLIAAGGIASGSGMAAAFALGAEGVQIGTRFALTQESSANEQFKRLCITLDEGGTMLALKKIGATRLIKNEFYNQIKEAEENGATAEQLRELLGKGRAKRGIFEGDIQNGELEIGQAASLIRDLPTAEEALKNIVEEFNAKILELNFYNKEQGTKNKEQR